MRDATKKAQKNFPKKKKIKLGEKMLEWTVITHILQHVKNVMDIWR